MASLASENKQKCVAAVLQIECVQKEMLLLDHATQAADDRILLVLLGKLFALKIILRDVDFIVIRRNAFDKSIHLNQ